MKRAKERSSTGGSGKKSVVVLDLDETLVSAVTREEAASLPAATRAKAVVFGKGELYVFARPGLCRFLQKLEKRFVVVIWTAGTEEYAKLVNEKIVSLCLSEHIPPSRVFHRKHVEISEKTTKGKFHKDLDLVAGMLNVDPAAMFIIDNRADVFAQKKGSAIRIMDWIVTQDPFMQDVFLDQVVPLIDDVGF